MMTEPTAQQRPVVTVVSGSPTPEELAAIVAVVTAGAAAGTEEAPRPADRPRIGGWKSYTRVLRGATYPGPGAWRHIDQ
jgi:hypothetical protein